MIRVVLAVLTTLALFGISLPAIESVQTSQTEDAIEAELQTLDQTANELLETEEEIEGPGSRSTVSIEPPEASMTHAPVKYINISPDEFRYQVDGGAERTINPETPFIRSAGAQTEKIIISGSQAEKLILEPVTVDDTRKVHIKRLGSDIDFKQSTNETSRSDPIDDRDAVSRDPNKGTEDKTEERASRPEQKISQHDPNKNEESQDDSLFDRLTGAVDRVLGFIPW